VATLLRNRAFGRDGTMVAMAARRSELDRADGRPIDPAHPLAVCVQLKSLLLEEILSGSYGADGQLPTEHELCAVHGISRTPVHRALLALALLGRDRQPLTIGLVNLSSPHLALENIVAAGSIMAILPPMLLFAGLNRYYVRGLFAGATKG
jgi:Bacterial regulatory proteins, gntR family